MNIPTREECIRLLVGNGVPPNLLAHVKKVCEVAEDVCNSLEKKGISHNRKLIIAAALLHDVEKLKQDHVTRGYEFALSRGYPEVAQVIRTHGLEHLDDDSYFPKTIEEKVVFYADKRVKNDEVVSVDERFSDIKKRYPSTRLAHIEEEIRITKEIEKELIS